MCKSIKQQYYSILLYDIHEYGRNYARAHTHTKMVYLDFVLNNSSKKCEKIDVVHC